MSHIVNSCPQSKVEGAAVIALSWWRCYRMAEDMRLVTALTRWLWCMLVLRWNRRYFGRTWKRSARSWASSLWYSTWWITAVRCAPTSGWARGAMMPRTRRSSWNSVTWGSESTQRSALDRVCWRSTFWHRSLVLRQEIGWEERLRNDLVRCRVGRKTLTRSMRPTIIMITPLRTTLVLPSARACRQ